MKTRMLLNTSAGIIASGLLAAVLFAGPGPQYWQQMERIRAERAAKQKLDTPAKMEEHPTGKCDGCKTITNWAIGDRGPAGKGVGGARVTGYTHTCTGCTGKNVTENGKFRNDMKHAAGCAALACCK